MPPTLELLDSRDAPLGDVYPCVAMRCDNLRVYVYPNRDALGHAVAHALVAEKRRVIQALGRVHCVYAAAPSQDDVLRRLVADESAPWRAETAICHMDEYTRLPASDPRSFRHYLNTHLFGPLLSLGRALDPGAIRLIRGDAADPAAEAERYAEVIRANPPDVVQGGIGEVNAHIGFNDPPDARFDDPALVKVVELAPAAKAQQVHEGHFRDASEIPAALTLTVPALTRFRLPDGAQHTVRYWSCVAPTAAKATAVEKLVLGEVTEAVPATVLRTLPNAALFLDAAAASRLRGRVPGADWAGLD